MSVRLKVEHGQDAGKTWGLKQPGVYVIGRDGTSDIRVLDMKVSKGHCEIQVDPGADGVWLRDLKSTHGTQLNGQPVAREARLKAGDEIRLGFTVLRLLSDGPSDTAVHPSRGPNAPAPPASSSPLAATSVGPAPTASVAAAAGAGNGGAPRGNGAGAVSQGWAGGSQPGRAATGQPAPHAPVQKELPPDELVGKDLAGYRVLKKIGQGGMGSVYIAEQVSLKREVALKVLSEKFVADSAFVDQFLNEARAAGALNHPNVVQVYDVGQADGRYFFSMEFVPGGSIEDKIRGKAAEWREALNWFLDAANALIFAGKRGILHRDVKPDNLMLAEDGSAKLCDLGLAKKSESADLLAQGIIGTPHFISPEAIRRKGDIDTRTDLYSLGCTFYRIITGQNPYPATTVKDILLGHLNKPVPRVTDKKPDVPKELSDVVFRLMQKEPAERFTDADALYTALDKIRIQHGLAEHGIQPQSRRPLIIALLLVLVAAVVVGYVLTRETPPPQKTVAELEAEQRLRDQAAAGAAGAVKEARLAFVATSKGRFFELKTEVAQGRLEDTWANAKWDDVLKRFEDLAVELEAHEKFGKDPEVLELVADVRSEAQGLASDRNDLRVVDSRYQEARKASVKAFTDELEELRRKHDGALVPEAEDKPARWWDAARLVSKEAMKKLQEKWANPRFVEGQIDLPLLRDEERKKLFAQLFPGEDWPGQTLYRNVLEVRAAQVHGDQLAKATKLAEDGAIESIEKAAGYLQAYRDALPEPEPPDVSEVSELLRKHRGDALQRSQQERLHIEAMIERQRALDRLDYFQLIHLLREPGRGACWTNNFSALDGDPKRLAEGLRRDEYKTLAQERLADARALAGLYSNLVSAFAAKLWTDIEFEGPDGKKVKVLDVGPEGLTCPNKVKVSFVEMGPKTLLERVFLPGGKERFAFSSEDLRALAVLAEMAGDGQLAQTRWMAYKAKVGAQDPAFEQAVVKRLGGLALEMQAAKLWLDLKVHHEAVRQFEIELALHPPKPPLTPVQRDKILRERFELERHVAEAGQNLAELGGREDLAGTVWGASVLPEHNPRAAYAGERIGGSAPPAPAEPGRVAPPGRIPPIPPPGEPAPAAPVPAPPDRDPPSPAPAAPDPAPR